jgi:hypothetical protein
MPAQDSTTSDSRPLNIPTPTLGGKQFWADELVFHQWRIQRNTVTRHCRLLDGDDVRRAWGTYEQCSTALDEVKRRDRLPPMKEKVVILLHGLGRTRSAMDGMANYLKSNGKYEVVAISYPSAFAEVEEHAKGLQHVLDNLRDAKEIDFVAHSLGNLVIRRLLYADTDKQRQAPDPRIKRIVMLGAPNNGSQLATNLASNKVARQLIGDPGREIGAGWDQLADHLAVPKCEFGVIAGGKGGETGYNPLLLGDNDMIVTVAETRLPGASDFLRVSVVHTFLMDDSQVQKAALNFLEHGYFVSEAKRQPIEKR